MKIKSQPFELTKIDYRKLKPIQGALKNLSAKNYQRLKKSFQEKGLFIPMFVWKDGEDFRLLDGHGRERLFQSEQAVFVDELGNENHEVPCLLIHADSLKDAKEKLLIISSQYQSITQEGFDEFTFDLDTDWLADTVHFDGLFKELEVSVPREGMTDEDAVPATPSEPRVKRGEIYALGRHRLACGDAASAEDVALLMAGTKAVLVFTDPPYNIASNNDGVASNVSKAHEKLMGSEWDKNFDFASVAPALLSLLAEDASVYVCTSHHLAGSIWQWMKTWADHSNWCVWSKPNPMPSLMKRHWTWSAELVCYATRGKHIFNFPDSGHALSVWEINKKSGDSGHPCEKPVAVPEHAILHSSKEGQIVVDLFMGSGTTLIACEKNNRVCYGMEIDPAYCDVIIERWEDFTGEKAERIDG